MSYFIPKLLIAGKLFRNYVPSLHALAPNLQIEQVPEIENALPAFRSTHPAVVLLDMADAEQGLKLLVSMRRFDNLVPVILTTEAGEVDVAIKAMQYGAYDYLVKPFRVDELQRLLREALHMRQTASETGAIVPRVEPEQQDGVRLVGSSEKMQAVYKLVGQVASQDVTVLILGESGTGKELVARAIYEHSQRKQEEFLEINCAALPETLLESELFGYEKGAFTGASQRRLGKFELANAGTMFLDEIGEMSLLTQAKVLRVIQTGTFTRLGGSEMIRSDVRFIVATNRDLKKAVEHGGFREDLYYRLNVISIHLPPLRDRREDIPHLAHYFLQRLNGEMNKAIKGFDDKAMNQLTGYSWPGNVRQLENCVRRAVVLAKSDIITSRDIHIEPNQRSFAIPSEFQNHPVAFTNGNSVSLEALVERIVDSHPESDKNLFPKIEKSLISSVLKKCGGNQVKAARLLGINRNTLRNRMRKHRLSV